MGRNHSVLNCISQSVLEVVVSKNDQHLVGEKKLTPTSRRWKIATDEFGINWRCSNWTYFLKTSNMKCFYRLESDQWKLQWVRSLQWVNYFWKTQLFWIYPKNGRKYPKLRVLRPGIPIEIFDIWTHFMITSIQKCL